MKKCIKCGSHAFNLYAEEIDQGGFCDVHYWQGRAHRAEALAQPKQEPVAWMHEWEDGERIPLMYSSDSRDNDEPVSVRPLVYGDTTPPLPEQEPVITVRIWRDANNDQNAEFQKWHTLPDGEHTLYTTPPQRPWAGLTDEDMESLAVEWWEPNENQMVLIDWVDAKLKDKNT